MDSGSFIPGAGLGGYSGQSESVPAEGEELKLDSLYICNIQSRPIFGESYLKGDEMFIFVYLVLAVFKIAHAQCPANLSVLQELSCSDVISTDLNLRKSGNI